MSQQLFRSAARDRERGDDHNHDLLRRRTRPEHARPERTRSLEHSASMVNGFFRRLAFHYRLEAERMAREWERERGRDQGWER